MLDGVAHQVLEHLFQPGPVGVDRPVDVRDERRAGRPDRRPAALGHCRRIDRLDLGDGLVVAGQRQDVLDQGVHPVQRAVDTLDVVAVALRLQEF